MRYAEPPHQPIQLTGAGPHALPPSYGPPPLAQGMHTTPPHGMAAYGPAHLPPPQGGRAPSEKELRSLPPYVVEPPDILLLDAIRLVPRPPYTVSPLDVLLVRVAEPLPNQPIEGTYTVAPDGSINLGYSYGMVRVGGMTLDDVERAIRQQLGRVLKDPQVAVGLAQFRGVQQVRGEHLVRPDGTINLGSYGCVYVAGLTLMEVKTAVERHLAQYTVEPEVNVDVLAYNSKVFYVIQDGAGFGQQVYRLPVTGKETVLDAISQVQGLAAVASKKKVWVARPAPADHGCLQILPVDWRAITEAGATATNYQLFPGDRVYVGPDPLILFDNIMYKVLSPVERLFGITLFGNAAIQSFNNNGFNGGGTSFIAPIR
jgi:polysaccharide export outer membrane protein